MTWLTQMIKKYGLPNAKMYHVAQPGRENHNWYMFQRSWWGTEDRDTITVTLTATPVQGHIYLRDSWEVRISTYQDGYFVELRSDNPIKDKQIVGALIAAGLL